MIGLFLLFNCMFDRDKLLKINPILSWTLSEGAVGLVFPSSFASSVSILVVLAMDGLPPTDLAWLEPVGKFPVLNWFSWLDTKLACWPFENLLARKLLMEEMCEGFVWLAPECWMLLRLDRFMFWVRDWNGFWFWFGGWIPGKIADLNKKKWNMYVQF